MLHGLGQRQEPVKYDVLQGIVQLCAGGPGVVLLVVVVGLQRSRDSGPLFPGIQGQPDRAAVAYG
jgi:hypothetical protein